MKTFIALALFISGQAANAIEVRNFDSGSLENIRAQAEGKVQIINYWSVDCTACYKELSLWQALSREYPQLKLVLISTDPPSYRDQVVEVIEDKNISHLEHWQFNHTSAQRLRYEIDPTWYGELPRTYLYQVDGQSMGISGLLDEQVLRQWLAQSFPTK